MIDHSTDIINEIQDLTNELDEGSNDGNNPKTAGPNVIDVNCVVQSKMLSNPQRASPINDVDRSSTNSNLKFYKQKAFLNRSQ